MAFAMQITISKFAICSRQRLDNELFRNRSFERKCNINTHILHSSQILQIAGVYLEFGLPFYKYMLYGHHSRYL